MLSRVASNLYWLSRYLQRVEITARLIRVHSNMLVDLPSADPAVSWLPLVSITGGGETFRDHDIASDSGSICHFLISDERNPGSMIVSLQAIADNLRSSRSSLSTELYELIKELYSQSIELVNLCRKANLQPVVLRSLEFQSQAIAGAISNTINRDASYLFIRAGCLIERADMSSRILDVLAANLMSTGSGEKSIPYENTHWNAVLHTFSAHQMYMTHAARPAIGLDVLFFLLQNPNCPQSIHYCLKELASCIQDIGTGHRGADQEAGSDVSAGIPKLEELIASLQGTDFANRIGTWQQLHDYMTELQKALLQLDGDISERYFPTNDVDGKL